MPTGGTETITAWKSKTWPEESIKLSIRRGNSLAPKRACICKLKIAVWNLTYRNIVNFCINTRSKDLTTDFTLGDCLFKAVKLTKNADSDKYGYIGNDIGFYARSQFSLSNDKWGKNVVIFGMSNS